jgi:hypothetical protein
VGRNLFFGILAAISLAQLLIFRVPSVHMVAILGLIASALGWYGEGASLLSARSGGLKKAWIFLPLLVPVLLKGHSFEILAWNLDASNQIVLGWFVFSALWFHEAGKGEVALPKVTPWLFILFSMGALWCSWVWDFGGSRLGFAFSNRLSEAFFPIWEGQPFSKHLGLAFLTQDDFKAGIAYGNHRTSFLLLLYGMTKFVQKILDPRLVVATRCVPFFYCGFLLSVVAVFVGRIKEVVFGRGLPNLILLFFGIGFLVSAPSLWIGMLRYNLDNIHPLTLFLVAIMSIYAMDRRWANRKFIWAFAALAVLNPNYAIIMALALPFFGEFEGGGRDEWLRINRPLCRTILGCGALAVLSYLIPLILLRIGRFHNVGSGLLFRSGLDGEQLYFKNLVQALLHPYRAREWSVVPSWVLMGTGFLVAFWGRFAEARGTVRQLFFLSIPYLFSLVFFSQSVSIHPYLYDYQLTFPIGLMGMFWMFSTGAQARLRGPGLLAMVFLYCALIINNLTTIAQAAR